MSVVVVTGLAHGCPVTAIVTACCLDERTVRLWGDRAELHGNAFQEQIVCHGQVALGQVQVDELCVTTHRGTVWVATAMSVCSRVSRWGEVSKSRDTGMIVRLLSHVKEAASRTTHAVFFAVDGCAAYPNATSSIRSPRSGTPVVKDTRRLARTPSHLERDMLWSGVVENVWTVQSTLQGTPAMTGDGSWAGRRGVVSRATLAVQIAQYMKSTLFYYATGLCI